MRRLNRAKYERGAFSRSGLVEKPRSGEPHAPFCFELTLDIRTAFPTITFKERFTAHFRPLTEGFSRPGTSIPFQERPYQSNGERNQTKIGSLSRRLVLPRGLAYAKLANCETKPNHPQKRPCSLCRAASLSPLSWSKLERIRTQGMSKERNRRAKDQLEYHVRAGLRALHNRNDFPYEKTSTKIIQST